MGRVPSLIGEQTFGFATFLVVFFCLSGANGSGFCQSSHKCRIPSDTSSYTGQNNLLPKGLQHQRCMYMCNSLTTKMVKDLFLKFFKDHNHYIAPPSSLLPAKATDVLFTNAGMLPFKDYFLGTTLPTYKRMASCQPCVRAGGKHNDLAEVGYTTKHHTYFEMLGNFSFGDYFKREAIWYAWKFLTDILGLPIHSLYVTVHTDDVESYAIWKNEIGLTETHLIRGTSETNFWSMDSKNGPCGYCSEIYYEKERSTNGQMSSPLTTPDRFVEIWNLVFMEYQATENKELLPLERPSVDTGMGLERLAAVLQNVSSTYEIDIFQHLKTSISSILDLPPRDTTSNSEILLNILADHIRSTSSLLAEDLLPSTHGRGYVLRRLIRRAFRSGASLMETSEPFFHRLVEAFIPTVLDESLAKRLQAKKTCIEGILRQEEEKFSGLLKKGMTLFEAEIRSHKSASKILSGESIFRLYDTFGFPVEITNDLAKERGFQVDFEGFQRLMRNQKQRSRTTSHVEKSIKLRR